MTTSEIRYPANLWVPADGAASNLAPEGITFAGTQTSPHAVFDGWGFDAAGTESIFLTDIVPVDYVSGGTLILLWTANATTNSVVWGAKVSAVTPADADTQFEHAFSTEATVTTATNATEARRLNTSSITLNMDSAAAGDEITFHLYRKGADGSDTVTVDAELWVVSLQYVSP